MKSSLRLSVVFFMAAACALSFRLGYAQTSTPPASSSNANGASSEVTIPGPLRSFLRIAAISQKAAPEEVMQVLARNVFLHGYAGTVNPGQPKEFLVILRHYVEQARELAALAGSDGVIRISDCQQARPLLGILGYRFRLDCGQPKASLITSDPERAFLTIDSGFPLPQLEEALQRHEPFVYAYPTSRVPILFTERDWVDAARENKYATKDLVDFLLRDPVLARLYWALSHSDSETASYLLHSVGLKKLRQSNSVLDFYGSHIAIRAGAVVVPGGKNAEPVWRELVGASPATPAEFVPRLLNKDKGWLAAYFDGLSRVNPAQQAHFSKPERLRSFYDAFRGTDLSSDATKPAFRPAPGLLLLLTRVQWEPNGQPHIPGNLETWQQIFHNDGNSKIARAWLKRSGRWNEEQFLEAMFACSRIETDSGLLQIYLALSDLDARRAPEPPLSPHAVLLMANKFPHFRDQYRIFSEFPQLTDTSIEHFMETAERLEKISNHTVRGNAMGSFQAELGLWQILARQQQIPMAKLDASWQGVIKPFARIISSPQLVDADREALRELLLASTGNSSASQAEIVDLLAGPKQPGTEAQQIHQTQANHIRLVMEGQRLVSLDTLTGLSEGLRGLAKGDANGDTLLLLARDLGQFEMPRPIFTSSERNEWAAGVYNNSHTESQMRVDLSKVIKPAASREKLEDARGQLASFYRDTLVGLNYAYYEPPGSQLLHNNPLFVRSHDFSGDTVSGMEHLWQAPLLFGEGSPAGGGVHLVGSLADLPYVLAAVEQDFLTPENVQALICKELVPGLLVNSTLPRWWSVTRNELHAVALYQRMGEQLITASVEDEAQRKKVLEILGERLTPQRVEQADKGIRAGHVEDVVSHLMPSDTFYLAVEFARRFPSSPDVASDAAHELQDLVRNHPAEVSWDRLSRDFGIPHPVLTQSYARELLNVESFPAFAGDSNRLLAESWDSPNLYWARLADEMGYSPAALNQLVPQLSLDMVQKIAASYFEDWPAVLRALRETGEDFKQKKIALR